MAVCGTAGANPSVCLDECSGREEQLDGIDRFKYRYYITGDTGDLKSLPADPKPSASHYPFTIKCYRGYTSKDKEDSLAESGTRSTYNAVALTGYVNRLTYNN